MARPRTAEPPDPRHTNHQPQAETPRHQHRHHRHSQPAPAHHSKKTPELRTPDPRHTNHPHSAETPRHQHRRHRRSQPARAHPTTDPRSAGTPRPRCTTHQSTAGRSPDPSPHHRHNPPAPPRRRANKPHLVRTCTNHAPPRNTAGSAPPDPEKSNATSPRTCTAVAVTDTELPLLVTTHFHGAPTGSKPANDSKKPFTWPGVVTNVDMEPTSGTKPDSASITKRPPRSMSPLTTKRPEPAVPTPTVSPSPNVNEPLTETVTVAGDHDRSLVRHRPIQRDRGAQFGAAEPANTFTNRPPLLEASPNPTHHRSSPTPRS